MFDDRIPCGELYLPLLLTMNKEWLQTNSTTSTLSWKFLSPWCWVLLTEEWGGGGTFKSVCKNVPRFSCSHPSQAHACFQAFVNDTGRPWRPQTSLVSKTESKSTVLFPPVFCFYHRRTVFCHLDSILLASENEHKQHLPWPGFPEECPLSICAKDAACMR